MASSKSSKNANRRPKTESLTPPPVDSLKHRLKWQCAGICLELASDDPSFVAGQMLRLQGDIPKAPPRSQPSKPVAPEANGGFGLPQLPAFALNEASPNKASVGVVIVEASPLLSPPPESTPLPQEMPPPEDAFLASLLEEFQSPTPAPQPTPPAASVSTPSSPASSPLLEQTWQANLQRFTTLAGNLRALQENRTPSKMEYLLVSAWFLSQQAPAGSRSTDEKTLAGGVFTLRKVQSELQVLAACHVGYADMEFALDEGYVDVLPDMTGEALVTLYRLTSKGVAFVESLVLA